MLWQQAKKNGLCSANEFQQALGCKGGGVFVFGANPVKQNSVATTSQKVVAFAIPLPHPKSSSSSFLLRRLLANERSTDSQAKTAIK